MPLLAEDVVAPYEVFDSDIHPLLFRMNRTQACT